MNKILVLLLLSLQFCKSRLDDAQLTSEDTAPMKSFLLEPAELTAEEMAILLNSVPKMEENLGLQQVSHFDPLTVIAALKLVVNMGTLGREVFDIFVPKASKFNSEDDFASAVPESPRFQTLYNFSKPVIKTWKISLPPPKLNSKGEVTEASVFTGKLSLHFIYNSSFLDAENNKFIGHFLTGVTFVPNIKIADNSRGKELTIRVKSINVFSVAKEITKESIVQPVTQERSARTKDKLPETEVIKNSIDPVAAMTIKVTTSVTTTGFFSRTPPDMASSIINLRGDSSVIEYFNGDEQVSM